MKRSLALCIIVLASGCVGSTDGVAPSSDPLLAVGDANETFARVPSAAASVAENATTRGEAVNFSVATDGPVQVSVRVNGTLLWSERIEADRTWVIALPYGRSVLEAGLVAPGLERTETFNLTRLAATKIVVDYGVFHPSSQGSPRSEHHELWVDVSDRPSAPLYAKQNAKPLDAFTAHDQLVVFEEETGKKVEYGWNANFRQYGVNRIDGAGNAVSSSAPPWWCYSVNGRSADGISIQRVAPGDSVVWRLGTCS